MLTDRTKLCAVLASARGRDGDSWGRKAAPRTGAEWSIAVVRMVVAVGQILRPGEAGRFLRRCQRRHAAVQVGARRTTVIVALIGEDKRPVLWQKLLTEASLADYQAKVERLIAASQRGPGMTFLSFCCPLGTEINQSFCL